MSSKLAGFVRAVTGLDIDSAPRSVPGHRAGSRVFYVGDDDRALGPALRWARSEHPAGVPLEVHVLAPGSAAPTLARRAALLEAAVEVWVDHGDGPTPAEAEAHRPAPALPDEHWALASVIAEAGARPVDDHGVLVGEVAGLEVARVVDDADGRPRLDVGVGLADRELQQVLHGHLDDHDNLRRAIGAVARHRRPGSGVHPLSRVARQRWLRSMILDRPDLLQLDRLEPVVPLRPKGSVLGTEPAAAAADGVVVVCSVGVDLDLVPEAADYRARVEPSARLILLVPERDRALVGGDAGLAADVSVVSLEAPWAGAGR